MKHLVSGGASDPLLPRLIAAINSSNHIRLASAFIRNAGLDLIWGALSDALARRAKLEIITGDYQCFTEPQALRRLMLLKEAGASVRVYECGTGDSFHVKAYVFCGKQGSNDDKAFVGSSNLTRLALTQGLEWNLCVSRAENQARWTELEEAFAGLAGSIQTKELTHFWIDRYENSYRQQSGISIMEPGADEVITVPTPNSFQASALSALAETRSGGNKRGLVVMATGLGKTWLAAFDCMQFNARRLLFVAHREEILSQAEDTFVKVNHGASVGRYDGSIKDLDVDLLFASVQTLSKSKHLDEFASDHFDYVVVDEFHHAAAKTYLRLLSHFKPRFLLGLTATPDRTDQSDILSLCDDNLVFSRDIFDGIRSNLLSPFAYYGIADDTVNYQEIGWRNGKFEEDELFNQLATHSRAEHNLREWRSKALTRTLAFCVSTKHADFMAKHFSKAGVSAVAVHSKSDMPRNEALQRLSSGDIEVIFSVDLFNEGVDLPSIDTVMMLRPTESKIIFMQQLGRGLRRSEETQKEKLVVLDFIGNHISFFRKAEALFKIGTTNRAKRNFLDEVGQQRLPLPEGCFVNYDLEAIEFLRLALGDATDSFVDLYKSLKESLGRRPTLLEFFRSGGSVAAMRSEFGDWFSFVDAQSDLEPAEKRAKARYSEFFEELLITKTTKCFKLILLEAFIDLNGFQEGVDLQLLAETSFVVISRKPLLVGELREDFIDLQPDEVVGLKSWARYWRGNPVKAFLAEQAESVKAFFHLEGDTFKFSEDIPEEDVAQITQMVSELLAFRYMLYEKRVANSKRLSADVIGIENYKRSLPIFDDLEIACGNFRKAVHESSSISTARIPISYGDSSVDKHFLAKASGDSMNGGDYPIQDGDLLLFEAITDVSGLGSEPGIVAVERNSMEGKDEFLLRTARKLDYENWELVAANDHYANLVVGAEANIFARLVAKVLPEDLLLYEQFMKHEVPEQFGMKYIEGVWKMPGHVVPKESADQFLFVNLSKQGIGDDYQYHDYFVDPNHFHWQSQNRTTPESDRGQGVINHESMESRIHLFVRKFPKVEGKGAPFLYCGTLKYLKHSGSAPMDVDFRLDNKLPDQLFEYLSN